MPIQGGLLEMQESVNRNILVTGGAGYIGSHVCKVLSDNGYFPITLDNMTNGNKWAVKWGPLEKGDIRDRELVDQVIKKYNPDSVMHFAADAYVGESVANPGKYYNNNVTGTITLLESLRDHDVDKIVFSSTCATYGIPQKNLLSENHPQNPINPYGASKFMIERILDDFDAAHGLRSISLRYFNAAGADPNGEIGEHHVPETHLIPIVLDVAMGKRSHVTIFGDDYETDDGSCVRDYIHVTDLAEAHLLSLKALESGSGSNNYNLGNGKGFSVKEVIDATRRVTGEDINVKIGSRRSGDPPYLVGSYDKIKQDLQWHPKFTKLDEIIETAWNWHKKYFNHD